MKTKTVHDNTSRFCTHQSQWHTQLHTTAVSWLTPQQPVGKQYMHTGYVTHWILSRPVIWYGIVGLSHQYWWTSTGCVSKRESSTNSASWCSSASTAWHLRISEQLQQVAQLESRQRLRSFSSSAFVVPATRRSTLGDRSFSAAGTRAWNSLPPTVTAASTLSSFRRYLKSHLFTKSFPSWR